MRTALTIARLRSGSREGLSAEFVNGPSVLAQALWCRLGRIRQQCVEFGEHHLPCPTAHLRRARGVWAFA
jgi:hypothetical protein